MSLPKDYAKSRAPKHDEYNPRPPRHVGQPHVCQCCYRPGHDIFNRICDDCLKDRHEVALVEKEIAGMYPKTASMKTSQILKKLWKWHLAALKRERALKLKLKNREDDLSCLTTPGR